jgi:predicted  nucleic acid-binding Zn-ribbon protein
MLVLVLSGFSGCTKAPDAEQSSAQAALATAVKEGADQYAPTEMEAGKMLLAVSDAKMKEEKFTEAKVGYLAAREAFEKAVKDTVAARQALSQEVNTMLSSLEAEWKAIGENIAAVEAKMNEPLKEAWTVDSATFAEGLQIAKDMAVNDAASAKAKITELSELADKWKDEAQKLTAAAG